MMVNKFRYISEGQRIGTPEGRVVRKGHSVTAYETVCEIDTLYFLLFRSVWGTIDFNTFKTPAWS